MKHQPERKQPVLTIQVLKSGHQSSTLKLMRPDLPDMVVKKTRWGHANLAGYYQRYYQALEYFKGHLQRSDSLRKDTEVLTKAFTILFTTGKALFRRLFQDSEDSTDSMAKLREITNYLRNYIEPPYVSEHHSYSQIGVIEVIMENFTDIIPVECLVIPGLKAEVRGLPDVIRTASRVLGFSFIIKRVIGIAGQSQKRVLNNVPRLPLKYFSNNSIKGAKDERAFFERYRDKGYFCLDGPWPQEDTEFTVEDFVRYLFRPDVGFGQTGKTDTGERPLDEIHHLSCHAHTDEKHPWKSSLRLAGNQRITLEEMEEHLADLECSGTEHKTKEMPLVFFNACETAEMTPKGMISFPQYFLLDNKNCGFIGTETGIPGSFASEFCQQFYLHLLRGCGVGEAIFEARHTMLRRYNNPLGILYTSYVDPYLKVARAADSI
ncbi:MAG: CHAT domain-containing protein [Anaerolineales bacterium]|nr:MAG: CHAT domain-containing protein [Anaerolineales bacterium]